MAVKSSSLMHAGLEKLSAPKNFMITRITMKVRMTPMRRKR